MFIDVLSSWCRKMWSRRSKVARRPIRKQKRMTAPRLQVEALENRLIPTATQVFGGLELLTAGTFTTSNHVVTSTSSVQVGVNPAKGSTFNPLLRLDGGV